MKHILLATVLLTVSLQSFSQCDETDVPRVLLIGDSWANFMNSDGTIDDSFEKWGHSNIKYVSSGAVAINGSETDDFLEPDIQASVQGLIDNYPTIDYIHLSVGGNDVLGDWNIDFTQEETDSLADNVQDRLLQVVDFLHGTRPGMKVLWSGYTYPNFGEVIETFVIPNLHPFFSTWDGMGQPSFEQINVILNYLSASLTAHSDTTPNFDFVPAMSILQYQYGQDQALGVAPGGTYPAFTQSIPIGDPTYPSPKISMRDYGVSLDAFHLSPDAYYTLINYHTRKFYQKQLMDDKYFLSEGNGKDGAVSDQGSVSTDLLLGSSNGENYATVLSFNTTSLPDTGIEKASLFLRREAISGLDPTAGELQISVKNGTLGVTMNVEAEDYTATADKSGIPCKFGSNGGVEHWIRIQLPDAVLSAISNSAETQIRIVAANASGEDQVTFSNSTNPDFAPVLNVKYGITPNGISDQIAESNMILYPNPASNLLHIDVPDSDVEHVQVFGPLGTLVMSATTSTLDVGNLPAGIYMARISTTSGASVKRFVKD